MAVPEGATKLGTVGIAYKGVYDELETYKYANAVYYNGSTYIALIDNPAGFPRNDGVNWRYLAQGFLQQAISALTVIDESGILGEVDAEVNAQEFLSKIAELEQGLENTKANKADILDSLEEIVANTEEGRIAGANAVSELNSNLVNIKTDLINYTDVTGSKNTFVNSGSAFVYSKTGNKVFVQCLGSVNADVIMNTIYCSYFPEPVFGYGVLTIVNLSTGTSGSCVINASGQLCAIDAIVKSNHVFAICGSYICKL